MNVAIVHDRQAEIADSEHVVDQLARGRPDPPVTIPIVGPQLHATFAGQLRTGATSTATSKVGYRRCALLFPSVPTWSRHRHFGSLNVVIVSSHAFVLAATQASGTTPTIAYAHSRAVVDEVRRGNGDPPTAGASLGEHPIAAGEVAAQHGRSRRGDGSGPIMTIEPRYVVTETADG